MKIGIYPGSFNPFHIGHKNIVDKSDKLFDKVTIAQEVNLDKVDGYTPLKLNKEIRMYSIEEYFGLLTDFIKEYDTIYINSDITIIRGFRNIKDIEYQQEQDYWCKKLYPEFKSIYIQCDEEFKYISSSAIRQIQSYKQDIKQYLP